MRPRTQIYLLYFDTERCRAMGAGPYNSHDGGYERMWAHADALRAAGHEDIDRLRSPVPPPLPPGRLLSPDLLAEQLP
jgi:hypothetical protein